MSFLTECLHIGDMTGGLSQRKTGISDPKKILWSLSVGRVLTRRLPSWRRAPLSRRSLRDSFSRETGPPRNQHSRGTFLALLLTQS